jgi:hypothetical protein
MKALVQSGQFRHACLSVRPSVCSSIRTHGTNRLTLDGFS